MTCPGGISDETFEHIYCPGHFVDTLLRESFADAPLNSSKLLLFHEAASPFHQSILQQSQAGETTRRDFFGSNAVCITNAACITNKICIANAGFIGRGCAAWKGI